MSEHNRETIDFDVVIVGGGPAGLATAIRLRNRALECDKEISVALIEKAPEIGAHILSGAVIDPVGLDQLLPRWKDDGAPLTTRVREDRFYIMTRKRRLRLPQFLTPRYLHNKGAYVGSLGALCKWLGEQAENLGVEIFPGFAGAALALDDQNRVCGVITGDLGRDATGAKKANFTPGVEIRARYTVLAEGARGSLSKQAIARFHLDADASPQKFGLGIKEKWRIDPEKHRPGRIEHSLGWPLDRRTGGGGFAYHYGEDLLAIGFVVHLDYDNPHLSPFDEFQRYKSHPAIADLLEDAKPVGYGARAISEGGFQSVPKIAFPGGILVGCAAGFVNVPRIKGSHNAILSGILGAEHLFEALIEGRAHDTLELINEAWRKGPIGKDLWRVRNVKPLWSRFGTWVGAMMLGGLDLWTQNFGLSFFGTMPHKKADHQGMKSASEARKIDYPSRDGRLRFDRSESVALAALNHDDTQPVHLKLADPKIPIDQNLPRFDEPAQRYCPAGVYEIHIGEDEKPKLQINAANCVHCKTCDIKDPAQNILWTTPEGGSGPIYQDM